MSKKNLARSVIEGGRYKGNKEERYQSHADTRAEEKNYLTDVKHDLEHWYDYDIAPTQPVYQGFRDKLGPMYRWLRSQVGKRWDEVRAEVTKTFDTRTTAGRHIVYDHLLSSVEVVPDVSSYRYRHNDLPDPSTTSHRYNDFYVDDEGILRVKTYIPYGWKAKKIPPFDTNQLANWLSGRVVGKVGNKYFWFVPADKNKKRGGYSHIWRIKWGYHNRWNYSKYGAGPYFQYLHYEISYKRDSVGKLLTDEYGHYIEVERKPKWVDGSPPALRQDRKLTDKEMKFWNTVPEYYQTKVLERSPNYPLPVQESRYPYYY